MASQPTYRLLDAFRTLFDGSAYLHRNSSQGDRIAGCLYEDLYAVARSSLLPARIAARSHVLNKANKVQGVKARRGDGTFGELVPGIAPATELGFVVARGPVATVEIGAEVKILAKAMIKQIDRVTSDLVGQAQHFGRSGGNPIRVGIVGINHAAHCVSYEGTRVFATDGKKNKHPIQEAADAEARLLAVTANAFDELLILRFRATNESPYPFSWVNYRRTFMDYGAILTRISRTYDARFR